MAAMVLDSSMTLAWFLPDEAATAPKELLDRVTDDGAVVPSLWPVEVGNAFLVAQRARRVTAAARMKALQQLALLPIELDTETTARAWSNSFALGEHYGLTLYDAVYLELAIRRDLPLASFDRPLCNAARSAGVEVFGG